MIEHWLLRQAVLVTIAFSLWAGTVQGEDWKEQLELADLLSKAMEYHAAIAHGDSALALVKLELGTDVAETALVLNRLADYRFYMQDYRGSEPLRLRALAILKAIHGPDHPSVATCLINLAVLCRRQGKLAEAEPLLEQALGILTRALGPNHALVGLTVNNLASVYHAQGRRREALAALERATSLWEGQYGRRHEYVTMGRNSMGLLHAELGNPAKAESLLVEVLSDREAMHGPDHTWVAHTLLDLAGLYRRTGRSEEAVDLLERGLRIAETLLGNGHPHVARYLLALGDVYCQLGRPEEAGPLLERALQLKLGAQGPDAFDVAEILATYSHYYRLVGRPDSALEAALRSCRGMRNAFMANGPVLSERDALSYAEFFRTSFDVFLSCYHDIVAPTPEDVRTAADMVLSGKGLVSDMVFRRHFQVATYADSATIRLAEDLRQAQYELSEEFVHGAGDDETAEQFRTRLDSLGTRANRLEAQLARKSTDFRNAKDSREIDCDGVSRRLANGSSLVEYLKYAYHATATDDTAPRYLALTIRPGKEPALVDLGDAEGIDELVREYRSHMRYISQLGLPSYSDATQYRSIASKLYERTFESVESLVAGDSIVLLSPDGDLCGISFAGMIDNTGEYLISRFELPYVLAAGDLVRFRRQAGGTRGLLAMADPDFFATTDQRAVALSASQSEDTLPNTADRLSLRRSEGDLRNAAVEPLPRTRREIQHVAALWREHTGEPAATHTGAAASETCLRAEVHGKRAIHLATHGFFLEDTASEEPAAETAEGIGSRDPLLRSGLFLAGANLHTTASSGPEADDGILTALEVAALDLRGTELVVLSACESGLGVSNRGEGVRGLCRAFQMAGAARVVSALWPIPDQATVRVMDLIYGSFDEGLPRAMREMALNQIREIRSSGSPDHPFAWAAFVAVGDWR